MSSSLLPTLGNLLAIPSGHKAPGVLRTRCSPARLCHSLAVLRTWCPAGIVLPAPRSHLPGFQWFSLNLAPSVQGTRNKSHLLLTSARAGSLHRVLTSS